MSYIEDRVWDMLFCKRLGEQGFRPYARMTVEGIGEVEFISYPWPEKDGSIHINARTTPEDPTTMKEFKIVRGTLVAV